MKKWEIEEGKGAIIQGTTIIRGFTVIQVERRQLKKIEPGSIPVTVRVLNDKQYIVPILGDYYSPSLNVLANTSQYL